MSFVPINNEILFKGNSGIQDAFGRVRISDPYTIFDSQMQFDTNTLYWAEKTSGTATITHLPNESSVSLTIGTASGDSIIRQSKVYCRYQPGKSQMVLLTGVIGNSKNNVESRIGYFDNDNGLYFQQSGSGMSVGLRSKITGSVVDTLVSQTSWNLDKMDGTGISGINLDFTKAQIFIIDIEWLGVGRVRFGFVVDGNFYYCHEILNANNIATVYMTTANLPARYEIVNVGTSASSTTLKQICTSVISEGGFNPRGRIRNLQNVTAKNLNTTIVPLLSFRIRSGYKGALFYPINYEILNSSTNNFISYQLLLNPTLTGASWVTANAEDCVEYDISATAVTGGLSLEGGFISVRERNTYQSEDTPPVLGINVDGVSDIICLAARTISGASTAYTSFNWKEVR